MYPCLPRQNSKVDLHILPDWQSEDGGKINLQFKTAYQRSGNNGYFTLCTWRHRSVDSWQVL